MYPARPQRAPGSSSPLSGNATPAPSRQPPPIPTDQHPARGNDSSRNLSPIKSRNHHSTNPAASAAAAAPGKIPSPIYAPSVFSSHPNSSTGSLQNFSRPSPSAPTAHLTTTTRGGDLPSPRLVSSATTRAATRSVTSESSSSSRGKGHHRKHSQGHFEPTLPSTSTSNLSQIGMAPPTAPGTAASQAANLSASQIAAQAAVLTHKQAGPSQHFRQRSQTVPPPTQLELEAQRRGVAAGGGGGGGGGGAGASGGGGGGGASKGPLSPPMVSLTEASMPRESGFSNQGYSNGLKGSHSAAATTAANVVFSRSGQTSPLLQHPPPVPEKPSKPEKSKGRLFSRPRKISTKGEADEKPLPSPGKIGSALSALQRGNFSTSSLVESSASSIYSMANSSTATIRPIDTSVEKEKEKEKKHHHFLSRGKHKLKEEYHLASSSSSFKAPEPHALSSLYNLSLPPSPASNTTTFSKSISGLDLRHAGRRDKRKEDHRSESRVDSESIFGHAPEWGGGAGGGSSFGSHPGAPSFLEPLEPSKYGLTAMSHDDAWPFLRAKLLVVFEGEDLKLPVEDFNRVVLAHLQYCIQRRSPNIILDDVRDLLATGFSSLDRALRKTPEDRVIPALVELWLFTFTSILPYMQAVLLPLDLEFAGCGTLLTPDNAREFWGGVLEAGVGGGPQGPSAPHVASASSALDVRRLVLNAYRDIVILPRYDTLRAIFSRLSLEFLPSSLASMALASPPLEPPPSLGGLSSSPSESFMSLGSGSHHRPGTAMSTDPALGSYNSSATTLLGGDAGRNRAASNVSFGSVGAVSDGGGAAAAAARPFTPSSLQALGEEPGARGREQNAEDSKQVAELAGRMLQCTSVLASVGSFAPASAASTGEGERGGEAAGGPDEMGGDEKMEELGRLLKLNWLGRGRTGRNRRGIVGGRVMRQMGEVRVA